MSNHQTQAWRILHIDDDEEEHIIVKHMLSEAQGQAMALEWAATAVDGRQKLNQNHYQAVLVDYDLGGETGIDLIREFVNRGYTAPLILLTGRGSYDVDMEAMRAGATLYLSKNEVNPLLLERSIRYAIERKETENRLRNSEEKFSIVFDLSPTPTFLVSYANRQFVDVNQAFLDLIGFEKEEVIGKTSQELGIIRQLDAWQPTKEALSQLGFAREVESVHYTKSGQERLTLANMEVIEVEGEKFVLGTAVDITQEKQAEDALRQSEARFQDLANHISQLAWMADENGWIFWYNQRWFDYTGTTLDEMQGWGWQKVHHPEHVDRVVEKISTCFQNGESWEDTFPLRGKDGQYCWFLSRAQPIRDGTGKVIRWFGTNTDITGQLQLENENRQQKDLLERLVQVAQVGIAFVKGPQHVYDLVNAEYENHARGKGRLVGKTMAEVWPEIADVILPQLDQVYETGEPLTLYNTPLTIIRDGVPEEDYFTSVFTPIFSRLGDKEGVMILTVETTAAVRDRLAAEEQTARLVQKNEELEVARLQAEYELAERERAEHTLQQTRDLLHAVLENAPTGVLVANKDGRIILANARAREMVGGEVTGDAFGPAHGYELYRLDGTPFIPDDLPLVFALRHGAPATPVEILVRQENGAESIILATGVPLRNASGEIWGATAVLQEITERVRFELALRASEERYRLAARAVNDAIWDWNLLTDNLVWSEALQEVFGYSEKEQNFSSVQWWKARVHPDDFEAVVASIYKVIEGREEVWKAEYRFLRVDGSYAEIYDRGWVVRDEKGHPVRMVGAMRDITKRKRAEEAMQQYAIQLEQANRELALTNLELEHANRELRDFAYIASHDLQEPLRKVIRFGELLSNQYGPALDGGGLDYVDRMVDAAGRMYEMIDGLLDYSRISTRGNPFTRVDLKDTISSVLDNLEILLEQTGGTVDVGELPVLEADPLQMQQLFQNLIGNALKFHDPERPPQVRVWARSCSVENDKEPCLCLHVEDNGVGFDPQLIARLFQPFIRLHGKSEYRGTGMGLAICRKIVERHGGIITGDSEPGEGSIFTVKLPLSQAGKV